MMRTTTIIILLAFIFAAIGRLFWQMDWIYNLPTPIPAKYQAINKGEKIDLPIQLKTDRSKPLFIHFFNPDCPCSRFNVPHFKSLVAQYSDKVNFAIVIMNNKNCTVKSVREKFGLDIPVVLDRGIAEACGVYSTPQAVLADTTQQLFYRGNYNRTRYCADKKTEYARMAIDALLYNIPDLSFNKYALTAYGCEIPKCSK